MKKILLFALMLTVVQLGAQNKEADAALKAFEKAKAGVTGKNEQNAASWVKLGKSFMTVYDFPAKNIWVGLSSIEAKVLLKDQRPTGTESVTITGEDYNVVHYADKDLYYDTNGTLVFWVVTKPLLPLDLLGEAYDAFHKGYELDAKGSQKKEIVDGLSSIQKSHITEAMTANSLGDYSLSSKHFGKAIRSMEHPAVNKIDTIVVFYTGLTAFYAKEHERALHYIQRAVNMGFTQEGSAYSYIAECYKALDQSDKVESVLAEGFTKYPSNQGILVSLINLYIDNEEDPAKIMEYIHKAQENEPTNESLFYAEGNVWRKLNNINKALECFQKSVEINPKYVFGYFSVGEMFYDAALETQNRANDELDDRKWAALMEEVDRYLQKAIKPFEKSFEISDNQDIKVTAAMYLKTIYYRMQGKDEAYKPLYEKYRDFSEGKY